MIFTLGGMPPPTSTCPVRLKRLFAARKRGKSTNLTSAKRLQLAVTKAALSANNLKTNSKASLKEIDSKDTDFSIKSKIRIRDTTKDFLNIAMTAEELVATCHKLQSLDGDISTSTLDPNEYLENFEPPPTPSTILTIGELNPSTASIYIQDAKVSIFCQRLNVQQYKTELKIMRNHNGLFLRFDKLLTEV